MNFTIILKRDDIIPILKEYGVYPLTTVKEISVTLIDIAKEIQTRIYLSHRVLLHLEIMVLNDEFRLVTDIPCSDISGKSAEMITEAVSKALVDIYNDLLIKQRNQLKKKINAAYGKRVMKEVLMDFGEAIKALKNGSKVARKGWNGKGMFVYYVEGGNYPLCLPGAIVTDETIYHEPSFNIKNAKGTVSTWVPSINDCLAEDWFVVK